MSGTIGFTGVGDTDDVSVGTGQIILGRGLVADLNGEPITELHARIGSSGIINWSALIFDEAGNMIGDAAGASLPGPIGEKSFGLGFINPPGTDTFFYFALQADQDVLTFQYESGTDEFFYFDNLAYPAASVTPSDNHAGTPCLWVVFETQAPVNTAPPVVSGSDLVFQTLSVTDGTWTGSPTAFAYQWRRDGVDIEGATSQTYDTVIADVGAMIDCVVTATNAFGSTPATSNSLGPIISIPPASNPYTAPLWRFVVVNLNTQVVTLLDHLASQRMVVFTLNGSAVAEGVLPSDSPEVNILQAGFPFVDEGRRCLLGFRREGGTPPWVIRFAGIIMQLEDAAQQDVASTHYTAYDPWQLMNRRPVVNFDTGKLPGPKGISWDDTRGDVIVGQVLRNTILWHGNAFIDAGEDYGGTAFYNGTLEATDQMDINLAQGTTVGDAWTQLAQSNTLDIILTPIYDPINRPGYLCELNVYAQAGANRDGAIFAWNLPSRSLTGITRLQDGTQRADVVQLFAGQGGVPATKVEDAAAIAAFGEYWKTEFLPGRNVKAAVNALATEELLLFKNGQQTVTISPAPERSPEPFLDYFLGDRVPVYASNQFRQAVAGYQRIYGIPIEISDDATEQIRQLLTSVPQS